MRRRLRRFEKIMNLINLFCAATLVGFVFGFSLIGFESVENLSFFGAGLLLFSGFLNVFYWIVWSRFN